MFEQAFKNIDDVLRKEAGCTTELDYTEQTSWLLFLKYLDALEQDKADEAALERKKYTFLLDKPYRWEEWAYARLYQNSAERLSCLAPWTHLYNWHRPHASLDQKPPITRSGLDVNNLLRHHI
jgi:transposase InsO family protein